RAPRPLPGGRDAPRQRDQTDGDDDGPRGRGAEVDRVAKLILISSDDRQEFELAGFNSIGRHPDNTIQILDRIISKEHAQIQHIPEAGSPPRALASLNGTSTRGERAHEPRLVDGDEISLGSTRLLFVAQKGDELPLHRVTIAPGTSESHIRQKIAAHA